MTSFEERCMIEDEEDRLRAMTRTAYSIADMICAYLLGLVLGTCIVLAVVIDAA